MTYTKQSWVDSSTVIDKAHMDTIEQGIFLHAPAYGTSLPASPADGQEAVLVDSTTAPTYQWRFRYNAGSSSGYKWEFIGGSPLEGGPQGAVGGIVPAHGWLDLSSGPVLNTPRAGDYEVQWGLNLQCGVNGAVGAYEIYSRVIAGGAVPSATTIKVVVAGYYAGADVCGLALFTGVGAASYKIQASVQTGGSSSNFNNGWLRILPKRVS